MTSGRSGGSCWTDSRGTGGRLQTASNGGDSAKSVATTLATSCDFAILTRNLHPL
jgi:hypothetical protein